MTRPRLEVYPDFAVIKPSTGKPKIKGRRRKTESPVQFLTRMAADFPATHVDLYFKRNGEFEKVER